jgi:hypothetical protein
MATLMKGSSQKAGPFSQMAFQTTNVENAINSIRQIPWHAPHVKEQEKWN